MNYNFNDNERVKKLNDKGIDIIKNYVMKEMILKL